MTDQIEEEEESFVISLFLVPTNTHTHHTVTPYTLPGVTIRTKTTRTHGVRTFHAGCYREIGRGGSQQPEHYQDFDPSPVFVNDFLLLLQQEEEEEEGSQ